MKEEGRGPRAGECGGNFPADQSRFPHTHEDDSPFATAEELHRSRETLVNPVCQVEDGIGLHPQYPFCLLQDVHLLPLRFKEFAKRKNHNDSTLCAMLWSLSDLRLRTSLFSL